MKTRVNVQLPVFLALFLSLAVILTSIYGLVLAFKVSIILGVLTLFVQPMPIMFGLIGLFGHPEVCEKLVNWIGIPF